MDRASGRDPVAAAIELLARAELSEAELRQKLTTHGFPPAEIDLAVERLKQRRILNDRRLAELLIVKLRRKGFADGAVREKLRSRGMKEEDVEASLGEGGTNAADLLASKRWKNAGQAARFLAARGFDADEAREAIESHFGDKV